MSDDNEFARYLASYLSDNYNWVYGIEYLDVDVLEKLIKEFMEKLP